jgi:hypothetical protein
LGGGNTEMITQQQFECGLGHHNFRGEVIGWYRGDPIHLCVCGKVGYCTGEVVMDYKELLLLCRYNYSGATEFYGKRSSSKR